METRIPSKCHRLRRSVTFSKDYPFPSTLTPDHMNNSATDSWRASDVTDAAVSLSFLSPTPAVWPSRRTLFLSGGPCLSAVSWPALFLAFVPSFLPDWASMVLGPFAETKGPRLPGRTPVSIEFEIVTYRCLGYEYDPHRKEYSAISRVFCYDF